MSRRGRPLLDPTDDRGSVKLGLSVPARVYEAVSSAAQRARVSIPEFVRVSIREQLRRDGSRSASGGPRNDDR